MSLFLLEFLLELAAARFLSLVAKDSEKTKSTIKCCLARLSRALFEETDNSLFSEICWLKDLLSLN